MMDDNVVDDIMCRFSRNVDFRFCRRRSQNAEATFALSLCLKITQKVSYNVIATKVS